MTDTGSSSNLQIRYLPSSMGIDVAGNWNSTSIDENAVAIPPARCGRTTRAPPCQLQDVTHYALMGYDSSSMEALVWEDLTNTPSICTAKSLQTA